MVETRTHRHVSRSRKKGRVPLQNLRTSEVVRTIVDHPRRLGELLSLLDDSDRVLRGRAATTLARLAESHPGRLVRSVERLRDSLSDDSAFVRWHLVYTLGRMGGRFPLRAPRFLPALVARLEDDNRIVRVFASRALRSVALRRPAVVQKTFESAKHEIPPSVARVLKSSGQKIRKRG
jgi:hypothetical protein